MSRSSPAVGDAVGAIFDRGRLSGALAATHRAGFGPFARVFDGARGDLAGQLRRAGLRVPLAPDTDPSTVLIVVTAPGRAATVADILARAGARSVHGASRGTVPAAETPRLPPAETIVDADANAAS